MTEISINLPRPGETGRFYMVVCGVCEQHHVSPAVGIDAFLTKIKEDGKWRLSRNNGWCHNHCMKELPATLKL